MLLRILLKAAVAAALLAPAAPAPAEELSWRDVESRIQYAYYTEDARALRNLESAIAADASHDSLHGYYAALLAWRLALLTQLSPAAAPGTSATQLAQRCVSEADAALAAQADFADALALRAVCLQAGGAHTFAGYRAHRDLDRALQLAAHNPRVLLADAMSDYQLTPGRGGNKARALGKLRRAVAAFEAERSGTEPLPGWGAAEAWLLLGRDLLDQGDPVGARDALEHALLLAPQFAQARRLMTKITSG
jgi:tetratricopeptide (TPR) repeat protein